MRRLWPILCLVLVGCSSSDPAKEPAADAAGETAEDAGADAAGETAEDAGADAATDPTSEASAQDATDDVMDAALDSPEMCINAAVAAANMCSCDCAGTSVEQTIEQDCTTLHQYACKDDLSAKFTSCVRTKLDCPGDRCKGNTLQVCGCSCGDSLLIEKMDGWCSNLHGTACGGGSFVLSNCEGISHACPFEG